MGGNTREIDPSEARPRASALSLPKVQMLMDSDCLQIPCPSVRSGSAIFQVQPR